MNTFYIWFWSAMILCSIAWYTILLFYLGVKGTIEIQRMTRTLGKRQEENRQETHKAL
ncbi:MAG: hypothetical protein ACYC6Y_05855 [Thermoguttaceae bacterium]